MATTRQKWVGGGAVVLAIVLLYAAHNSQTTSGGGSGAEPCTVTVTADTLNVRSRPDDNAPVVQTYAKGEVVSADRTVRNGYRQLGPDRWAARDYLSPRPGSDCG